MNDSPLAKEELCLLGKYDTPTVCNVIELFDIRPRNSGYMDRRIKACFPDLPPIVGYAATATFRASAPPTGGDAYATLDRQIAAFEEIASPPIVVFEDLDDPPAAATFGEIMCTSYQKFGAAGLITSGAGRDLQVGGCRAMASPVHHSWIPLRRGGRFPWRAGLGVGRRVCGQLRRGD